MCQERNSETPRKLRLAYAQDLTGNNEWFFFFSDTKVNSPIRYGKMATWQWEVNGVFLQHWYFSSVRHMVSSLDGLNISHNFFPIHAPITQTDVSTDTSLKLPFCIFPLSKQTSLFDVTLY